VKTRSPEDLKFILSKDKTVGEVSTWIDELFKGSRKITNEIPTEIIDWATQIILDSYSKAVNKEKTMCLYKILHTHEVVQAAQNILQKSQNEIPNEATAYVCAFLHDIGRFPQALTGTLSDTDSKVDHGDLGAHLVAAQWPEKAEIIEAVKWHNKLFYPYNSIYAKFTRDADKLAILEYAQNMFSFFDMGPGLVSTEVLERFLDGKVVTHAHLKNRTDAYVNMLSWLFDINLEATREICISEGVFVDMLDQIKLADPESGALVENSKFLTF